MTAPGLRTHLQELEIRVTRPPAGNTTSVLKMFDPMTLPSARSDSCRIAAMIVVTSSGMLVPMATTNKPTTACDTPN